MALVVPLSLSLITCLAAGLEGQTRGNDADGARKQATATRVPGGSIRLDGRLDEEAWQQARPITDFVQKEPTEGAPPTEGMEVRIVYDDTALYVGARMHNGAMVQAPMGRRDEVGDQSEHFLVSFDTFLDRRTAYTFGVTASGVRLDRFHPLDDENNADAGFDPVWQARTRIGLDEWTAELWIPFAQLRFNDQPTQMWGMNMRRFTPTRQEQDYWVPVPRTVVAWASRFGDLRGIEGLRATKRVELLPFIAGSSTMNANRDRRNPFDDGRNLGSRVGADVKMGLGPNLTLDATINPDFGQVEADPAEVNLTAFATRFAEKRPFFTEGARLLNVSHNNAFYSRRIGARPDAPASGDYIDYPDHSTILAAAKITGRLSSGTSIGVLSAVTDQESARTFNVGARGIDAVRVAPRTAFGLARVQQEFGRSASTVSALVATLHRNMAQDDPLANLLSRNALVYGGDALLRFRGGEYEYSSSTIGTYVNGEPGAITRIQRSSAHYMQRPDQAYARIDPTRTTFAGFSTINRFDRLSGRHWLFGVRTKVDSPELESNDIGMLTGGDGIQPSANATYRETRPGKIFRNYSLRLSTSNNWNFAWNRQTGTLAPRLAATWKNFWTTTFTVTRAFRAMDALLTRGGPLMERPRAWTTEMTLANNIAAQTRWSATISGSKDELGGVARKGTGTFSFRPGPRWQLSVAPTYDRATDSQQYATTLRGGRPETFGSRYIFSYIERSTVSTQFRLNFTFKPDLNLDVYAEPFSASGRYYDYGELLAAGSGDRITYGVSPNSAVQLPPDGSRLVTEGTTTFALPNRDFNVRSFRSNVVLRWEWRPGSTLYIVWQQDRRVSEVVPDRVGVGDMFRSLGAPGSNYFVVKTSFWLPIR